MILTHKDLCRNLPNVFRRLQELDGKDRGDEIIICEIMLEADMHPSLFVSAFGDIARLRCSACGADIQEAIIHNKKPYCKYCFNNKILAKN